MTKKRIYLFVLLIAVLLTACTSLKAPKPPNPDVTTTKETQDVTTLPGDVPTVMTPPVYHATVEYGEPDLITDNKGPLWVYIRFPIAGETTDAIIAEWARGVYQASLDEITELRKTDPNAEGEVNIQFDSYLIDDRFAGVLENGMFTSSHLAHPTSIVRTFNIDTQNGTLLENTDILDYSQLGEIFDVMRESLLRDYPETIDYPSKMDVEWLENIAIGKEGIIVVLERGKYFPTYHGTLKVTLDYDKLGGALILGSEPTPEPTTPEPTTPEPTTPEPTAPEPTKPPIIPNVPPQSGDIDPSKPMIALTFDDGPSKYTSQILDTLEKYNARATFCVVGNLVNARKDTVKRAFDMGSEIIGHSWDHKDLSKLGAADIKLQLNNTSAAIEAVTGVWPQLYRPPYGAVSNTLKSTSAELGYAIIYWSVDPLDWSSRNAEKVYNEIMNNASNKAIVLSHDLYGSTADAMERIIPELIEKGYQLVTVSELMYYSGKTLEAGVVYYSGK